MSHQPSLIAKTYIQMRSLVDRDLDGQFGRPAMLVSLVAVLPFVGLVVFGGWWLIPAAVLLAIWLAFVVWRAWWIFKTGLLDADEDDWVEPQ